MFIWAHFGPMYYSPNGLLKYPNSVLAFLLGDTFGFGYLGFLFILLSVIEIFRFSVSRVVLYRGLGMSLLGGVTIFGMIFYFGRVNPGGYLLLYSWIWFFITFIVLASTRRSLIETTENETREYIKKAARINQSISINKIVRYIRISKHYTPKLKEFIEEMINNEEILGNLRGNLLHFTQQMDDRTSSRISEKPADIEVDYKKRLFGMIRLRKEINLEEASQFLNIPPKQIESLLYDLAGEKIIQGKFQGNRFLIESDMDNFLNALDNSFNKWETDEREKV